MRQSERERLERSCNISKEMGIGGDQLLLVRLDDVEEFLQLDEIFRGAMDLLYKIKEYRNGQNGGKEQEDRECPEGGVG